MNELRLYTDLDSLFDTRRGILTKLARETNPKFVWSDFAKVYTERRFDIYTRPSIGITPEKFEALYSARSVDDWSDENECYFYPTNLLNEMLQIVRSIEFGSYSTIQISRFHLTVNCFPFKLSDALAEELVSHLENSFNLPIEIKLADMDYSNQSAVYLSGFDYVFRYGHLLRPEFSTWYETLTGNIRAGTKYIVPELLAKDFEEGENTSFLKDIPVADHIRKASAVLGGVVVFIPTNKRLYDYRDEFE